MEKMNENPAAMETILEGRRFITAYLRRTFDRTPL
jgi:hypothetical protein